MEKLVKAGDMRICPDAVKRAEGITVTYKDGSWHLADRSTVSRINALIRK